MKQDVPFCKDDNKLDTDSCKTIVSSEKRNVEQINTNPIQPPRKCQKINKTDQNTQKIKRSSAT